MDQYLITAFDFTDDQALERRMEARPKHFETVKELKTSGNFVLGGAILNEEGQMIGSSLIMQFISKEELDRWLENEPYVRFRVWGEIDIKPFRVAEV